MKKTLLDTFESAGKKAVLAVALAGSLYGGNPAYAEDVQPRYTPEQQQENFNEYLSINEIAPMDMEIAEENYAEKMSNRNKVDGKIDLDEFIFYRIHNFVDMSFCGRNNIFGEIMCSELHSPNLEVNPSNGVLGGFNLARDGRRINFNSVLEQKFGIDYQNKLKKNFEELDINGDGYISMHLPQYDNINRNVVYDDINNDSVVNSYDKKIYRAQQEELKKKKQGRR
jgi:hypothetical protein